MGDLSREHLIGDIQFQIRCGSNHLCRGMGKPIRIFHVFTYQVTILYPAPGTFKVDYILPVLDPKSAIGRFGDLGHQCFNQFHYRPAISVGLIDLEHGELGIMLAGEAFISEVPVQFIDLLESTDQEPFQIELRSDPEIHLTIERGIECLKRPRRRAARDHLHHRSLHFKKTPLFQKSSDLPDNPGAAAEKILHIFIHDQI